MKANNVTTISNRTKVLKRPARFIGSISATETNSFILDGKGKLIPTTIHIVPGIMKLIEEVIDNGIDEAIRTNYKFANLIEVKTSAETISVTDNGRGIPVIPTINEDGSEAEYLMPEGAWTKLNTGANFEDEEDNTSVGQNGEGVALTCIFSKEFIGETCDGKKKFTLTSTNNLEDVKIKMINSRKKYTKVTFKPDFEKFKMKGWGKTEEKALEYKLLMLSLTYPDIKFTLNGKHIKVENFKKLIEMISTKAEIIEVDNLHLAVIPNELDDFRFIHFINGVNAFNGGKPLDWVISNITSKFKELSAKKYPNIKVGDIKNKMFVVAIFQNMRNPRFGDQIKSNCENTYAQFKDTIGEVKWDAFNKKIYKNKDISDPILESFKLKEELLRRKELKGLDKPKKRIKSEKYLPATGKKKYLFLCEGASAAGGISSALGRENIGYYELKGVPLNAHDSTQAKFLANKELSELYTIVKNEGYEYIIAATDADLDGHKIKGLVVGFLNKYFPDLTKNGRTGFFRTPIMSTMKAGIPQKWAYSLSDGSKLKGEIKYFKGLGTHTDKGLSHIIKTDGLNKMIELFVFDDDSFEVLDSWLNGKRTDDRKVFIKQNDFDLIKA